MRKQNLSIIDGKVNLYIYYETQEIPIQLIIEKAYDVAIQFLCIF